MIVAFYSDPHFGHRQVIGYCDRPFADLDAMHAALIANYNAMIGEEDTVVWTGDAFFMGHEAARDILDSMHGFKVLVRGNHDGGVSSCARVFDMVTDEMHVRIGDRHCVVSHYPYAGTVRRHGDVDTRYLDRRPQRVKGRVLIHGHTHSPRRRDGAMIHVGVDAWDYRPATMAQVAALVSEV